MKCDVQIINEQIVQKQLVDKPWTCHVGRPKKVTIIILYSQEIEKEVEESTKDMKQQKKRRLSRTKDDGKLSKTNGS